MNRSILIVCLAVVIGLLVLSEPKLVYGDLLAYTGRKVLWEINVDKNTANPIGPTGTSSDILCMEFIGTTLYGSDGETLYELDTSTGLASPLGNIGGHILSLTLGNDGKLYGTAGSSLYHISLDPVGKQKILDLGPYNYVTALATSPSGQLVAYDNASDWLFGIDLGTNSTFSLGYFSPDVEGMDFGPDGTLYGWENQAMYTINIANLSTEHVNFGGGQVSAMAFAITPEPATLSLLALGGLALIQRRKHGMCK